MFKIPDTPDSAIALSNPLDILNSQESSEFICYSVYRLWHKQPKQQSFIPMKDALLWFPSFIKATNSLLFRTNSSLAHILLALLYVARLRFSLPNTVIHPGSEYKILVAALILAHKYHSDSHVTNKAWAQWAGLANEDVNKMEREFLLVIGAALFVKPRDYEVWASSMHVLSQEFAIYKKVQFLDNQVHQSQKSNALVSKQPRSKTILCKKSQTVNSKKYLVKDSDILQRSSTWNSTSDRK